MTKQNLQTQQKTTAMNKWFSATCDRFGHLITLGGLSTATRALTEAPRAEQVELLQPVAQSTQEDLKQPRSRDAIPNRRAKSAHPMDPYSG